MGGTRRGDKEAQTKINTLVFFENISLIDCHVRYCSAHLILLLGAGDFHRQIFGLMEFKKIAGTWRERNVQDFAIEKYGFYLLKEARYEYLLNPPEKDDTDKPMRGHTLMQTIAHANPGHSTINSRHS